MDELSSSNRNSSALELDQVRVVSSPEGGTPDGQVQEEPPGVSDGFAPRPIQTQNTLTRPSFLHQSQPVPSSNVVTNSAFTSPSTLITPSISKADEAAASFALQHDGQSQHIGGENSRTEKAGEGAVPGRDLNSAHPPQAGPSGSYVVDGFNPLVPDGYGLVADPSLPGTAISQDLDGTHRNVAAPQHPYALFPQNTLSEDNSISRLSPVPFGFPGVHQAAHGQQSLTGVQPQPLLGLDEQLPPYTRYPSTPPRNNTDEQGTSPAGDIGSPVARDSEIPQQSMNNSQSQITTHSAFSDSSQQRLRRLEKPANMSRSERIWTAIRKTKVCGGRLPLWSLISIVVIIILVLALVTGAVMGKNRHESSQPSDEAQRALGASTSTIYATTTTTYDASLLPSPPTGVPDLPFGTYLLTLGEAETVETSCLAHDEQTPAWSCDLSVREMPQIQVQVTPAQANTPDLIKISALSMRTGPVKYGTQPPWMDQPHKLSAALDQTDKDAGPAFVFQAAYNKLVILRGDTFNIEGNSKRAIKNPIPIRRSTELQPNDRPWYCHWNNTILEGFIYVSENATSSSPSSTPTSATDPASSTPDPKNITFPSYPKCIKLEERRDPDIEKAEPYCQQMQVLDDMNIGPVTKPGTEDLVIIYLDETEPTIPKWKRSIRWGGIFGHHARISERNYASDHCLCKWLNR